MKKKKIDYIHILSIIMISISLIAIVAFSIKIFINHNDDNIKKIEINDDLKLLIIEAMYNNYSYVWMAGGDVQTIDTEYTITDNGDVYYKVDDKVLENIDSVRDMIITTFVFEDMKSWQEKAKNNKNQYYDENDVLYVKKGENLCNIEFDYEINDIKVKQEGEKIRVKTGDLDFYVYENKGAYFTDKILFEC